MTILDLIFPKQCLECKREGKYICKKCISEMPRLVQYCPLCERASFEGKTHRNCKKPLFLDALFCLWPYKKIVRKAILAMKYKFAKEVAKELSDAAYDSFIKAKPLCLKGKQILIPVPTSRSRKNWRGFNQTEVIGEIIAGKLSWEYIPDMVIKKGKNKPQTGLKLKERKLNIITCMKATGEIYSFHIKRKRVEEASY